MSKGNSPVISRIKSLLVTSALHIRVMAWVPAPQLPILFPNNGPEKAAADD